MNLLAAMRYLVSLDEHRHFGRAAQACHITQPALSNALRALEAEFGVMIVQRGRAYAGLTAEGLQVLQTGQEMLQKEAHLRQTLSAQAGCLQGHLRMAAVPTAMPMLVRFAALLRSQHPGVVPVLQSMSSPELERGLEDLSLDVALGYSDRIRNARTQCQAQYQEQYYLLTRVAKAPSAEAALQWGDALPWAKVEQRNLCLLTPEMHNRQLVERTFQSLGLPLCVAMETNSVQALLQAVVDAGMSSIVPGAVLATLQATPGLQAMALVDPVVSSEVAFIYQQEQAAMPALQAALALMGGAAWRAQCQLHAGSLAH